MSKIVEEVITPLRNLRTWYSFNRFSLLNTMEGVLYEGIVEQKPHKVCTNLAGLLVDVPCKGCTWEQREKTLFTTLCIEKDTLCVEKDTLCVEKDTLAVFSVKMTGITRFSWFALSSGNHKGKSLSVSIVTSNENPMEPLFLYNRTTESQRNRTPITASCDCTERERERRLWA